MMYREFGKSFNKQPNHFCVERGSDVKRQKRVIGKRLRLEITLELLQELWTVTLLFLNREIPLD